MSDIDVSVDVSADFTDFGISLSPLGGGGGADPEFEYEYVDADDDAQLDGSVEIHFTDSGRKQIKKIKKKAAKPIGTVADAAVKLTAIAIDAMATPVSGVQYNGPIQRGKWSTGLCNCFDFCVPNCFMVTFCPCISAAQIATRIGFTYVTALTVFGVLVVLELVAYGLMSATMRSTELQSRYYYSYITHRYTTYTYEVTSNRLSIWAYVAYVLSVVIFIALWQLRTKVRSTFDLAGSCVEDCLVSFFCSCCSLAQMATHVKSYKPHTCDFGAPDELPAYSE